jgi:Ca-activated chloride channel family protein
VGPRHLVRFTGSAPWLVAALALAVCPVGAGQDQAFRAGTELVSIYATVTGGDGRLVPDLTRDDFVVLDNGRAQKVTVFSNDVQPITIVVMLDRSGSMAEHFELVQEAAGEFVKQLLPGDKARIGNFSTEIRISPSDFTSDRATLLDILQHDLQDIGPSPIWTAVDRSITALLNQRGRRVVLLLSDGHDAPLRGQVHTPLKDALWRAQVDEIMVYAIGLTDPDVRVSPFVVRQGRIRLQSSPKPEPPDPGLKKLAAESGGGYFELNWSHNLNATFMRVADELHRQYWLGFPPTKLDGKTHTIEVKVARSGASVRARKSYVAEPAK